MKKYLITGGSGFIGTNLINYISQNDPSSKIIAVSYSQPIYLVDKCKYILCSVANFEEYEHYIDENTIVVHLAWSGFPNKKVYNIYDEMDNNIISSCKLFETAINHNCRSIVFLSSGGGIYGKPLTVPIQETHPTTPLSYYGIEKLTVENYLRLMTSQSSTEAVILRASNPYGRFQRPFAGQGVIATFLASALLDKPVEVWGDGSAVRDYYYVDDLNIGSICIEDIDQEFYKKFREYSAYESKEKCLKTISLLKVKEYISNK